MSQTQGLAFVQEYWIDAWQRSILTLDTLRERGNTALERSVAVAPHVLSFDAELVLDGRTLRQAGQLPAGAHPCRRTGMTIDPRKRPFVVVDPRAGHGPGIGGFKADSELGVAMRAGHPGYFIGFTPEPMPGQTIEDIMQRRGACSSRR